MFHRRAKFIKFCFNQVTYAPVVPPIVLFLAKDPLVDKFDLSSVEEVLCAAAPMGDGLEDALSRRLPKVKEINQGIIQIGKMSYLNNYHAKNVGQGKNSRELTGQD